MMQKDKSGPAFPVNENDYRDSSSGMTLRDWFAGEALAGWLASFTDTACPHPGETPESAARVAASSYAMADAMLAERSKP